MRKDAGRSADDDVRASAQRRRLLGEAPSPKADNSHDIRCIVGELGESRGCLLNELACWHKDKRKDTSSGGVSAGFPRSLDLEQLLQ